MKYILRNILLILVLVITNSTLFELHAQTNKIDSLENLLQQHTSEDTIRINLLNETAYKLYSKDIDKTFKYTDEARELAYKLNFAKGKAESLRLIGIYYWNKADYPKALEYYEKSLKIFKEIGNKKGISDCYFNIGSYYKYHNALFKALSFFEKSLGINTELGDKHGIARDYSMIGNVYGSLDNAPKSLEYRLKALYIYTELNNKRQITNSHNNIGETYLNIDDYSNALKHYEKALEMSEKNDSSLITAILYENIGNVLCKQKHYSQSMKYLQRALKLYKEQNKDTYIAMCKINIGICYRMQNDFDNALEYFNKALNMNIGLGQEFINAYSFTELSYIYFEQNKAKEAYNYSKKAYLLAKKINNLILIQKNLEILPKRCNDLGMYEEAYGYNVQFHKISDSLFNEKSIKKIAALEYEYKYKKEIELLEENEQIAKVKLESEEKIKYFLSAILILLIVFVMFIIINRRKLKAYYKNELRLSNEIKESDDKQRRILNAITDGIYINSPNYTIEYLNNPMIKIIGGDKTGQKCYKAIYNKDEICEWCVLKNIKKDEITTHKLKHPLTNHTYNINNILLNSGSKVTSYHDITKIEESEAKLKISNNTKDKFFSIIAHDLKSPFNAILGFSNILLKKHKQYDNEKREGLIKSVNSSANKAFKLLENLLTWSRSQSGAINYSPENLHLKILLFETIFNLQEVANKKNINILDNVSENEFVYADKNMIATVFRNLISNAIKFTNTGGSILISSKKQTDSNFIEISVEDTGIGIPKEKIADLFRIDKNTSTEGTENEVGTGLGLILCKEFVEQHNGKIWIESEIKKGSKFIFTIPVKIIDLE